MGSTWPSCPRSCTGSVRRLLAFCGTGQRGVSGGPGAQRKLGVWTRRGCWSVRLAGGGTDFTAKGPPTHRVRVPLAVSPAQGCGSGSFLLARGGQPGLESLCSVRSSSLSPCLSLISMLSSHDSKWGGCCTITMWDCGNILSPCPGGDTSLSSPAQSIQKSTLSCAFL